MDLPFCLVDIIMKYAGAYYWDHEKRPYIGELHMLRSILPLHGVSVSLQHLKEYRVLYHAYQDKSSIMRLYEDAMHLC